MPETDTPAEDGLLDQYEFSDTPAPAVTPTPTATAPAATTATSTPSPSPSVPPDGAGAPAAKPGHSRYLREMAQDFGIPDEDIDAATPEELQRQVRHLQRITLAARHEFEDVSPARPSSESASPPQQAREERTAPRAPAPTSEPTAEDVITLRAEDGWEKQLIEQLRKIHEASQKKIAALEKDIAGFKQSAQQEQERKTYEEYDRFFAAHPEIYGEGTYRDQLSKEDLELRREVVRATGMDPRRAAAFHNRFYGRFSKAQAPAQPEATPEQPRRADGTFAPRTAPAAPEQPPAQTGAQPAPSAAAPYSREEWDQGGLRQPTQRKEQPVKGVLAAKRAYLNGYREFQQANGASDVDTDFQP